jgi:tetratricopeptide (TPR) repeat protein
VERERNVCPNTVDLLVESLLIGAVGFHRARFTRSSARGTGEAFSAAIPRRSAPLRRVGAADSRTMRGIRGDAWQGRVMLGPPERRLTTTDLESRDSSRRSPGATEPRAAVQLLQGRIGDAAVARLLARVSGTTVSDEEAPVTATGVVGAQEWGTRAYYHFQAGRYERSLAAWRKAFELYPVPAFLYNEASCLEPLKRYDEAADLLERYLKEPSPEPGVEEVKDVPRIQESIRRLRSGQPGSAPAKSQPAPEEPVNSTGLAGAQAWATRAWDHDQARRFERALAAYEKAYELYPLPGFLYNEAACLEQLGRLSEAADTYELYLKVPDPPDAGARQERDPEHVLDRIRRLRPRANAQAQDPVETTGRAAAQAWFDRGQLAYLAEDWDKALEGFEKAFAAEPLADFVYNEGATLEKLGRTAVAGARDDRVRAGRVPACLRVLRRSI